VVEHRYFISFFITTLVYLGLFGSYFILRDTLLIEEQKAADNTICMCLSEFVPPSDAPVEETPKEEPVEEIPEEPAIEEEPVVEEKPQEEPVVEETPKEEPVVEEKPVIVPEAVKPKPAPKPEKKKEPVKKKIKKHIPPKPAAKKMPSPKGAPTQALVKKGTAQKDKVADKNAFLAAVRQKINRHKSYPVIAKRRGMQGKVAAEFTILANGHVSNIKLSGSKFFHASARQAIEKAFPVSTVGRALSFPMTVNLMLEYRLTQN